MRSPGAPVYSNTLLRININSSIVGPRDGQIHPEGARAGCVGVAIHQSGWAVVL